MVYLQRLAMEREAMNKWLRMIVMMKVSVDKVHTSKRFIALVKL